MDLLPHKSKCTANLDFMDKIKKAQIVNFIFHRRRIKCYTFRTLLISFAALLLVYLQLSNGIIQRYFLEKDFRTEFSYPQDIDDFQDVVQHCLNHKGVPEGFHPPPQNMNYSKVEFLKSMEGISRAESIGLLIVVKSATKNYKKRMAIRRTWGSAQYLKENSLDHELPTKLAFISGVSDISSELFSREKYYDDMVLADFHDAYENNTYKTVLAMRWAVQFVENFKYLMIVDDDMYINLTNAITFLKDIPQTKVKKVTNSVSGVSAFYAMKANQLDADDVCTSRTNVSLVDKPLIMGHLIVNARPFRAALGYGSRWSVSIEEYPFNYFPPYIAGGATIFDSSAVASLYYGSFFTKHFWIDDVYIGMIAYKLGLTLTDNALIDSSYKLYFGKGMSDKFHDMIAIHGLDCPEQLIELWRSQDMYSLPDC